MDARRLSPPVVLIVDPAEDNREMYAEYLAFRGYVVLTARNGADAIAEARAHHPDVILLDLRLPIISGLKTLQLLRTEVTFAEVPIAALTAQAFDEDRTRALAGGFDAFLPKPCLPEDLVVAVEGLLQGRRRPL